MKNPYYFSRGWSIVVMIAVFTIMLLSTSVSMATNYTPPVIPPATPTSSQQANIEVDAAAKAAAAAAAKAQSASNSSAIGAGGDAGSYSASSGGALTDNSRSSMYVLPPPVWTAVPQAAGCIATSSKAGSLVLGLVSGSRSDQKSDPACVGVIMAKAAYDHCHFESEQMIMQRVYEVLFPGKAALPLVPGARNHTVAECEELKRPRLTVTQFVTLPVAVSPPAPVLPPVATQACPEPQKPAQRRVVKPKKAPTAAVCPAK